MKVSYIKESNLLNHLEKKDSNSLEFVFLATGTLLEKHSTEELFKLLENYEISGRTSMSLFVGLMPSLTAISSGGEAALVKHPLKHLAALTPVQTAASLYYRQQNTNE